MPKPFPAQRLQLLRLVVRLREQERLTFKAIAQRLAARGQLSARGRVLGEELVFSVYKKRPVPTSSTGHY